MKTQMDLRPSPIAGQWYPGQAQSLADSVDAYIEAATPPEIHGEIVAVIAPHAGYRYSGPVAGHAYAVVQGLSPEMVVVISPMHQFYQQPLLTSAHEAYQTPLGPIPIDQEATSALDAYLHQSLGFGLSAIRKDQEHSLEIELPFLQRALPGEFTLLPVMVRLKLHLCFLEAAASEHVSRMKAMRAATDNADQLLADLRRQRNRLRQSRITTELAEIMGGRVRANDS